MNESYHISHRLEGPQSRHGRSDVERIPTVHADALQTASYQQHNSYKN